MTPPTREHQRRTSHRPTSTLASLGTVLVLASGCTSNVDSDPDACGEVQTTPGPTMRPGFNCLSCHQDGFGDEEAPEFSAAGTVFESPDSDHCDGVEGVKVFLTGADGNEIELTTNSAGNFWTREPLMDPGPGPRIEFEGRSISMGRDLPSTPACNACHSNPPLAGAPGKIFIP